MLPNFLLWNLTLILLFINEVLTQGVNLGSLHWCGALCLCDDETNNEMHCFKDREIYSLIDLSPRKVIKLEKINFQMDDKLIWCNEICLCHKDGQKEFKCATREKLEVFINENAPHLSKYLEPEVEIYDMRDLMNTHDDIQTEIGELDVEIAEEEEESHATKSRHDKKKNRKHRKNKKKHPHEKRNSTEETQELAATLALPSTSETVTEPDTIVLAANVFPQVDTSAGETKSPSIPTAESETKVLEHPQERQMEKSEDFTEVQKVIEDIKVDVSFNQQVLLATAAVASLAMLGVIILSIYLCCVGKWRKGSLKSGGKNGLHQEEKNSGGKVNIDEAW